MIDEYGAAKEMGIGTGNWSTWRKPTQVIFRPAIISHEFTWD
jgi:hypothetical protein